MDPNIIVNNFMFCAKHGSEYCTRCCCDHRMVNNIQVEGDFTDQEREEFDEFGFDIEVIGL